MDLTAFQINHIRACIEKLIHNSYWEFCFEHMFILWYQFTGDDKVYAGQMIVSLFNPDELRFYCCIQNIVMAMVEPTVFPDHRFADQSKLKSDIQHMCEGYLSSINEGEIIWQ